ncbi:hypothetical protein LUZ60_002273 [Juncus effusus]|nr:hypothetical protein LUZ60_002273 [Juncus effusus]
MAGVGALISSLISSVNNLLPEVKKCFFAPSSSLSAKSSDMHALEDELDKLMRTLKRIKATLYDAEEREIRDHSVKLWLKELKEIGYATEYVIDEYMYEVYRAKVEAINASMLNHQNMKRAEGSCGVPNAHSIRVPDRFVDRIREIRRRFDEIAMDREALRLHEEDGQRRDECEMFRAPSSHLTLGPNVFGRENDKKRVIDLLFSNLNEGIIATVAIVGKGGLGKTTLAQLVYEEKRVRHKFDLFAWISVSVDFNVERLTEDLIESFTENSCTLKNLSTLQKKLKEILVGKRVLVVLDDVWNENMHLWELFQAPFMSAARVSLIVTTRSDRVAKIMPTTSPFLLDYLSEEESSSLFNRYAFGGIDQNVDLNLLDLGRKITKKCGGLPLALKSISNLLRYENEECWVEILEDDLWEINAQNEIFGALQISYTRLPSCLRPCFLYCSLFPKDYEFVMDELIELWIVEGYIESKGKRTLEEIAYQYALELRERSFFDPIGRDLKWETPWTRFKIHEMVHDLACLISGNEFLSIKRGKQPNPSNEVFHIYLDDSEGLHNRLSPNNVAMLRTLIWRSPSDYVDFSDAKSLRTLKLYKKSKWEHSVLLDIEFPKHLRFLELDCSIGRPLSNSLFSLYHLERLNLDIDDASIELEALRNLINLRYISISRCNVEKFLESLYLLKNLRMLRLKNCSSVRLPENLVDLAQLQELVIHACGASETFDMLPDSLFKLSNLIKLRLTKCRDIRKLPNGIGNLTNLQSLIIKDTGISYLPDSINRLNIQGKFDVGICPMRKDLYDTINWLKDFNNWKGTLVILQLGGLSKLEDARNFNLISKHNIEKLSLSWADFFHSDEKNKLEIKINSYSTRITKDMDFLILEGLQPHPNLKHLEISFYENRVLPRWIEDPLSCASLEKLHLTSCHNFKYLPFGKLGSLQHLKIQACANLQTISRESLPLELHSLTISWCDRLLSITGLENHESLVEVEIDHCKMLKSFPFVLISQERCHKSSLPKRVKICDCPCLKLKADCVFPLVHCNIVISNCRGLLKWCLKHHISYTKEYDPIFPDSDDGYSSSDGASDNLNILENSEDNNFDKAVSSSFHGRHITMRETFQINEVGSFPHEKRTRRASNMFLKIWSVVICGCNG